MNKIICGNAQIELSKLDKESIDLIITSPPYYKQRDYENNSQGLGDEKSMINYERKLEHVFSECVRVCKPTGNIVFNMGDKYIERCLQLLPYRFAIRAIDYNWVKLVNNIAWVKSNPTPRQYNKRLVSAHEPFFHFVKSNDYYYNRQAFLDNSEPIKPNTSSKKGMGYEQKIKNSNLTPQEKLNALQALSRIRVELVEGKISDFRMKIRGVHKKAFGGQRGGRNNQIEKQGYTIIRFTGKRLKRDIIESPVANTKNISHPAVFPCKVIRELILLLSKDNDVVLDPFCGSGQVCVVAKSLKRRYLGIDLNPEYCSMAEERVTTEMVHYDYTEEK